MSIHIELIYKKGCHFKNKIGSKHSVPQSSNLRNQSRKHIILRLPQVIDNHTRIYGTLFILTFLQNKMESSFGLLILISIDKAIDLDLSKLSGYLLQY